MKLIERTSYIEQLKNVKDSPRIKVITGVRRSGKSKLTDAFIDYIRKNPDGNIVSVKLNLKEFENLKNGNELYGYIDEHFVSDKQNYLFIDDVQLCNGFEPVISRLYEEGRFDIYLTGSNAFLSSRDHIALFDGRVFEIRLYPFSFAEYLLYYPQNDIDAAFDKYVTDGGIAGFGLGNNSADEKTYPADIVRSAITEDIVKNYKIENEDLLNMVVEFLTDNTGGKTSVRNVANVLSSNIYKTNDKTCGAYIDYLCKSFLFCPVGRYDVRGKRHLQSDKKYYLADHSLYYAIKGTSDIDYGHLYENMVAIELLRRGYEVCTGKLGKKEIDFVALKNGAKTYIQVCDDISREETLKREVALLLSIKDAYPKMIIARTKHPESQIEGIRVADIARWLSSQN